MSALRCSRCGKHPRRLTGCYHCDGPLPLSTETPSVTHNPDHSASPAGTPREPGDVKAENQAQTRIMAAVLGISVPAAPPSVPDAGEVSEKAQALVDQLGRIHADARYQSVFTLASIHGTPYAGPTYETELQALTATLAASRQERGA